MNDYLLLFSIGLLGALHCVGMCGGLVMACSMKYGSGASFSLAYNFGRVLAYGAIGLFLGIIGKALIDAGLFGRFQAVVPVIAGTFMIFIGLDLLGVLPSGLRQSLSGLFGTLTNPLAVSLMKKRKAAFVLGMFNGLIPCGFLYAAGIKAATTADPLQGSLTMISLGAGTFVPMFFAGYMTGFLKKIRTGPLAAFPAILIIALGVKSIFYGGKYAEMIKEVYHACGG